jgi:5-methylcytosine-specific restriction endonuclease McrA
MSNPRYVGWQTRMVVIQRDEGCVYCGKPVAYTTGSAVRGNKSWRAYDAEGKSFHFDHKKPFASGGTSGPENIVLACAKCNLSKGTSRG